MFANIVDLMNQSYYICKKSEMRAKFFALELQAIKDLKTLLPNFTSLFAISISLLLLLSYFLFFLTTSYTSFPTQIFVNIPSHLFTSTPFFSPILSIILPVIFFISPFTVFKYFYSFFTYDILFFYPLTLPFNCYYLFSLPFAFFKLFNLFTALLPVLTFFKFFSSSEPCFYVFSYKRFCSHKSQALPIYLPRHPMFFTLYTHLLDPLSQF